MIPMCGANRINIKKNINNVDMKNYINIISKIIKESN